VCVLSFFEVLFGSFSFFFLKEKKRKCNCFLVNSLVLFMYDHDNMSKPFMKVVFVGLVEALNGKTNGHLVAIPTCLPFHDCPIPN
jgi:hypothetical protein